MDEQFKKAMNGIYNLCDVLDEMSMGARSVGFNFSSRDLLKFDLIQFFVYVSEKYSYDVDTFVEKCIGEQYCGLPFKLSKVYRQLKNDILNDTSLAEPTLLILFIRADNKSIQENGTEGPFACELLYNVFETLGKLFVNTVSNNDSILERINSVLNSMRNSISVDLKLKKRNKNASNDLKIVQNEKCESSNESLEELLQELNSLTGLDAVKNEVSSLINLLRIRKMREERGLNQMPMSLHLVFSGNPGTGKTTVARLLAKIYHKLEILSSGHLVEVDRSGLVGGYVGQTAIKVQEVIQKSIGGILFIDEAYSLTVNKGESDYGLEAVDTLLKGMEDNRDNLVVIVAGYPNLMSEFLNSNPGLRSRFNKFINFDDYTADELVSIFANMCCKNGYIATEECMSYVQKYFEHRYLTRSENFANGREVRNFFEKAMVNQANRLTNDMNITNEELSQFVLDDVKNIVL